MSSSTIPSSILRNKTYAKLDSDENSNLSITGIKRGRPPSYVSSCEGSIGSGSVCSDDTNTDDSISYSESLLCPNNTNSTISTASSKMSSSDESDTDTEGNGSMRRIKNVAVMKTLHSSLEETKKRKAFFIANEILTTEKSYVDILRLLDVQFKKELEIASNDTDHDDPIIPKHEFDKLFKFLPQIRNINEVLLQDLTARITDWSQNPKLADIFIEKGPFLKMYISYIQEYENMQSALEEARLDYPKFDTFIKNFEVSALCSTFQLCQHLITPIQRITRYEILLRAYKKQLNENCQEYNNSVEALNVISEIASICDKSTEFSENFYRLRDIHYQLAGQFSVIKPGRELVKEGTVNKLSRKRVQMRKLFLFTDVLLCTKPTTSGIKVNYVISLSDINVRLPKEDDYETEFHIRSRKKSFAICTNSRKERDEWITVLKRAVKSKAECRESLSSENGNAIDCVDANKDFSLGNYAPVWVPDGRVSMCQLCTESFSITFRKHHCRACGKVVCKDCSDCEAPLRYHDYEPVRVCFNCFNILQIEMSEKKNEDMLLDDKHFQIQELRTRFRGNPVLCNQVLRSKQCEINRPSVLKDVRRSEGQEQLSGYMDTWKNHKWKKRWFVLKDKVLYTFKASEDMVAKDSKVILGYEIKTFSKLSDKELLKFCWNSEERDPDSIFELTHKGVGSIVLYADTVVSRDKWIMALGKATQV